VIFGVRRADSKKGDGMEYALRMRMFLFLIAARSGTHQSHVFTARQPSRTTAATWLPPAAVIPAPRVARRQIVESIRARAAVSEFSCY
jgi:hypothetical protein